MSEENYVLKIATFKFIKEFNQVSDVIITSQFLKLF